MNQSTTLELRIAEGFIHEGLKRLDGLRERGKLDQGKAGDAIAKLREVEAFIADSLTEDPQPVSETPVLRDTVFTDLL